MKQLDCDHYELSSGRCFYANRGIIGLSAGDGQESVEPSQGYDGIVGVMPDNTSDHYPRWTPEEKRELADFMVELWLAWGKS